MAEKNQQQSLIILLNYLTYLSDARLHWLWIRLWMEAGIHYDWTDFKKAEPVLKLIAPVTGTLSWSIYGLRFSLHMFLILHHIFQTRPHATTYFSTFINQCYQQQWVLLNDSLWGFSNGLSSMWLSSSEFNPAINTTRWWANMNMEILLVNDVVLMIGQFNREREQAYSNIQQLPAEAIREKNKLLILWKYKQQCFFANIAYNISLACGFFMLRGFFPWTNNEVSSSIGANLCVSTMVLLNGIIAFIESSKWLHLKQITPAYTIQALKYSNLAQQKYRSANLSLVASGIFPIMLWLSFKTGCTALILITIVAGLSTITLSNRYLKKEKEDDELALHYSSRCGLIKNKHTVTLPSFWSKNSRVLPDATNYNLVSDIEQAIDYESESAFSARLSHTCDVLGSKTTPFDNQLQHLCVV